MILVWIALPIALLVAIQPFVRHVNKDSLLLGIKYAHLLAKNINFTILLDRNVILVLINAKVVLMKQLVKNAVGDLVLILWKEMVVAFMFYLLV